jgi:thiol-disulfide isomerase/thioredoxin
LQNILHCFLYPQEALSGTLWRWYWRYSLLEVDKRSFEFMKGANAPDFIFKTLKGEILTRSQLNGRVVVFYFWNTQCKPCIAQMPALNDLFAMYKS